jgi:hypothetical protein
MVPYERRFFFNYLQYTYAFESVVVHLSTLRFVRLFCVRIKEIIVSRQVYTLKMNWAYTSEIPFNEAGFHAISSITRHRNKNRGFLLILNSLNKHCGFSLKWIQIRTVGNSIGRVATGFSEGLATVGAGVEAAGGS